MLGEDDDLEMSSGKRVGPDDVPPVTIGGTRYEVIHWGRERGWQQNGGYIAAVDAASNRERWTLKVYDVTYDPALEEDVQDVFIESMTATPAGNALVIQDEKGRRFIVNPQARSARPA